MNFAAFIKSISANPVTSIINFNKLTDLTPNLL